MVTVAEVLKEIQRFSTSMYSFYKPAGTQEIRAFESGIGLQLPDDYKEFLRVTDGLDFMGSVIYGIANNPGMLALEKSYEFEHYEVGNPMPAPLVPFSPDGYGNHYCFDTSNRTSGSCQVVFWQHDCLYDLKNQPEVVNTSFAEWAKQVIIDWTLEDYDYNGQRRIN